jgi:hypothetical protein
MCYVRCRIPLLGYVAKSKTQKGLGADYILNVVLLLCYDIVKYFQFVSVVIFIVCLLIFKIPVVFPTHGRASQLVLNDIFKNVCSHMYDALQHL